jgi:hypothetical protein
MYEALNRSRVDVQRFRTELAGLTLAGWARAS